MTTQQQNEAKKLRNINKFDKRIIRKKNTAKKAVIVSTSHKDLQQQKPSNNIAEKRIERKLDENKDLLMKVGFRSVENRRVQDTIHKKIDRLLPKTPQKHKKQIIRDPVPHTVMQRILNDPKPHRVHYANWERL
jgi:hypothetical protein